MGTSFIIGLVAEISEPYDSTVHTTYTWRSDGIIECDSCSFETKTQYDLEESKNFINKKCTGCNKTVRTIYEYEI